MGCGASAKKGEGSPSLNEYFQELRQFTEEEIENLEKLEVLEKSKKTEEAVQLRTKIKASRQAFKKVRERLLKDSFDHHDVSGDGILSEEESSTVFTHITQEKREHDKILALVEVRKELAHDLGMSKRAFENMDIPNEETIRKKCEDAEKDEAKRQKADIQKALDKALEDYRLNKVARDKVAFGILDQSKNSRIEKKEFLAAFDPTSEIHEQFMEALGLCLSTATKASTEAEMEKEKA